MELNLLPPVFRKLGEEFPMLRPSVRMVPFPSLLGMVENQKIHAAFQIKEGQKKSSLYFKELFSSPVSCVCSPDHPLAHYDSLTKEQLSGSIIACSPRQISATLFSIQNRILSHLEPEQQYFTESIESAFTLTKAGLGYVLYPDIPPSPGTGALLCPCHRSAEPALRSVLPA